MNVRNLLPVLTALIAISIPLTAHHSFVAEFDETKPIKMTGVVTKLEWQNPHIWFYVDVKDAAGKVTNWGFSGGAPGQLMRRGITKKVIQPGMTVQVDGYRARDGSNNGSGGRVTFADGRSVFTAGSEDRVPGGDKEMNFQRRFIGVALTSAVGFVTAFAQTPAKTADGKPDFSGMYEWPKAVKGGEHGKGSATIFDRKNFAPLKPGGEPFLEPRTGDPRHDEPRDFCMPAGFPSGMLSANAARLVQNKSFLVIAHEFQAMTRLIPLDGRPHRQDLEPMFYGDPVGHWEGDTLVIDTTNFKRWSLDDYFYTNAKEYRMHSAALHTVERMKWKDASTISYVLTIDDPGTFTASWSQEFEMKARPDWEQTGIYEYVCEENNRCPGGKCSR